MARLGRRLSREAGQDLVEYGGVLLFIAAIIGAVLSLNLPGAIAHAISCEVKQVTTGGGSCTLAAAPVNAGSAPGLSSAGAAGESQMEQILGSDRLIVACAGNGQSEIGADRAAQSQACKQQLAKLSPRAISTLELLAALFQAEHDYRAGAGPPCTDAQAAAPAPSCAETQQQFFANLLADYTRHPGDAVIALSRAAQQLQSGPILRNEKIQSNPGDLWDGFLGSLCGGYGICLGGTTLSQAYQRAYHTSAQLNSITTPVLLATGVAGALKDLAVPGLRAVLARLGVGSRDAQEAEQTVQELNSQAENGGGGSPPPGGGSPGAGGTGPGDWRPVNEGMSDRARAYQEQITGHPSTEGYIVGGVKFDGYRDGVLIDAKGPGYAWAVKDGQFIPNYRGAQDLVDQAQRQLAAAQGAPIEWDVAEPETAQAIKALFRQAGVRGITVRYVPPHP